MGRKCIFLRCFWRFSIDRICSFYISLTKFWSSWQKNVESPKSTIQYLCEHYGNFFIQSTEWHQSDNLEDKKWLNVQNVEPKFQKQRRHGKWQVVQTRLENGCNLKLDCTNVPNAPMYSAKYWVKVKSKSSVPTVHFLFFLFNSGSFKTMQLLYEG